MWETSRTAGDGGGSGDVDGTGGGGGGGGGGMGALLADIRKSNARTLRRAKGGADDGAASGRVSIRRAVRSGGVTGGHGKPAVGSADGGGGMMEALKAMLDARRVAIDGVTANASAGGSGSGGGAEDDEWNTTVVEIGR